MPGTVSEVSATLVARTTRRPLPRGRNILFLLGLRQDRRAYGASTPVPTGWRLRRASAALADFPFARQEHQDIARTMAGALVHGVDQGVDQVAFSSPAAFTAGGTMARASLGFFLADGTIAEFDRIQAARDFDDGRRPVRRRGKVPGEALGIDGGRRNDDLQVRPAR